MDVARIQVNLPEDLVAEVRARGLDVAALVEAALREAVAKAVEDEERDAAIAASISEFVRLGLWTKEEEEEWAQARLESAQQRLSKKKHAS